jgi:hypothetical protein
MKVVFVTKWNNSYLESLETLGLRQVEFLMRTYHIIDEPKFMLAVLKYGLGYKILESTEEIQDYLKNQYIPI